MSSWVRRVANVSGLAAVTQRRKKRGRCLTRSCSRVASSVSWSRIVRLVPALALIRNCGLSTKLECLRSPPALPSFHSAMHAAPQKLNSLDPERDMEVCSERSMDEESARAIAASSSCRIVP